MINVKEERAADTSGHLENATSQNVTSQNVTSQNVTSQNDETLAPTVPGDTSTSKSAVKANDINVFQGETNVFLQFVFDFKTRVGLV
jgi:hypothetical protein